MKGDDIFFKFSTIKIVPCTEKSQIMDTEYVKYYVEKTAAMFLLVEP